MPSGGGRGGRRRGRGKRGSCGICGQGQGYKLDFNAAYSLLSSLFTLASEGILGYIRLRQIYEAELG